MSGTHIAEYQCKRVEVFFDKSKMLWHLGRLVEEVDVRF